MGIKESSTTFYKVTDKPWQRDEPAQYVQCDVCRANARKSGKDPGEAAEVARKEGFVTKRGSTLSAPRVWVCLGCQTKPTE